MRGHYCESVFNPSLRLNSRQTFVLFSKIGMLRLESDRGACVRTDSVAQMTGISSRKYGAETRSSKE